LGEFVGSACWITTSHRDTDRDGASAPTYPVKHVRESFPEAAAEMLGGEPPAIDTELGAVLGAIAEEVHQIAAAVRAGIMADFAARAAYARKHLPRHLVTGALAAIKQMRTAALASARQNAKAELRGRKNAVIAARRALQAQAPSAKSRNSLRHAPGR
jgi:hypothetical protein